MIDKIAWIYIQNRKILSTRSKGKDTFYLPGGKRETGESDVQTLTREIQEELSVDLLPESLEYLGTFEAQAHGRKDKVRMTCYTGDYTGELIPDSEVEEIIWFNYADRGRSSPVDQLIFDWLKAHDLID